VVLCQKSGKQSGTGEEEMAATNATATKPTTTTASKTATSSSTNKTAATATSGHSPLLQFVVGFLLILVAAWFSNISDDTGNLGAGLFALLWFLWIMNNSSKLKNILP
jgi:hypothetical protein